MAAAFFAGEEDAQDLEMALFTGGGVERGSSGVGRELRDLPFVY